MSTETLSKLYIELGNVVPAGTLSSREVKLGRLVKALDAVRIHAEAVMDHMRLSAAGDCYEFHGGMNDVEILKDTIRAFLTVRIRLGEEADKLLDQIP